MGINKLDQLTAQPIFHAQIEEEGLAANVSLCAELAP